MLKRLLVVGLLVLNQTICEAFTPIQFGPLQADRYFQNTGGLIDHISPLLINKTQASVIQNVTMDDRGQLSKRNGYTVIQSTSVLGPSTFAVEGGTFHKAASGSDFFATVVGSDVFRVATTFSGETKVTGSVTITNNATNLAQSTHINDVAVFCNDLDKPFYVPTSGNAVTISTNTFDKAKTCATYGSYLVVANTSEGGTAFPNRIRWSDINNQNSFPSLNFIDIEPQDGDAITGIIAYEESIYIFKKKSIYRMLITGLDGPDAFIIRPYTRGVGSWAKMSIKVIPSFGVAFLAQNTAYLLNNEGLTPIGDPIQRTFDLVQRGQWVTAVGEVYPHRYQYWLAVSKTGTTNQTILVYDYIQRNWTTYTGITANMLAQSEDSTGQNILISGDNSAVTYKQDTGSTDNPGGVSTAIQATYTTADLTEDSPELTKGYKYLYIYSLGDQIYTLNIQAAYDYNSVFELNQNISLGSAGALYDTGIYDTDMYPASGKNVARIELNRDAKSVKLQFQNNTSGQIFGLIGWVIVYQPLDYRQ